MKDSKKKSPKEPVFLLETSHQLCSLMMKCGLTLRSIRARSLGVLSKGGPKSWVQMKLVVEAGESADESWDKAHQLAGKIKRELHSDVYVEPGSRPGRYHSLMVTPESVDSGGGGEQQMHHPSMMPHGPMAGGSFGPSAPAIGVVHGIGGGFGMGMGQPRSPMGLGAGIGIGMPGITPDVHLSGPMGHQSSGLPPEVEALMARDKAASKSELTCPALRQLPGWGELSSNKRQMFEVEAAQLIKNGLTLDTTIGIDIPQTAASTLDLVRLQPNVSKMLRHFLDGSFAPVAD